jgi:hypothetical protein
MGQGRLVTGWFKEVDASLKILDGNSEMKEFTRPFQDALARLKSATEWLVGLDAKDPNGRAAAANDYLRMFSLTVFGWMWVRMAAAALAKRGANDPFYDAKLAVGRYFMARVLPQTAACDAAMRSGSATIMALPEAAF